MTNASRTPVGFRSSRTLPEALQLLREKTLEDQLGRPHPPSVCPTDGAGINAGFHFPKGTSLTTDQKALKQAYTYLNYRYWFLEEHRNVLTLLSTFEPLHAALDPSDAKARLLALVALQRLVLSLLRVARAAVVRRPGDLATEAHQYIFGGATGLQERRHLVTLVNRVAPKPISLEPEYFGELLEIINRVVRFAASSRSMLRLIDGVIAEEVTGARAEDILGAEWSLDALAIAKRTADLFVVATSVRRELFHTLLAK